jgi:hypothetical protein
MYGRGLNHDLPVAGKRVLLARQGGVIAHFPARAEVTIRNISRIAPSIALLAMLLRLA